MKKGYDVACDEWQVEACDPAQGLGQNKAAVSIRMTGEWWLTSEQASDLCEAIASEVMSSEDRKENLRWALMMIGRVSRVYKNMYGDGAFDGKEGREIASGFLEEVGETKLAEIVRGAK